MERKTIVIGNWKLHKTAKEAQEFIQALSSKVSASKAKVLLAVPFTAITKACQEAEHTNIVIGSQNISNEVKGAFTGEISSIMLKAEGADFSLIGHSERRHIFFEDDKLLNKKVLRALEDDLMAVFCIGETDEERHGGLTEKVLEKQLKEGLKNVPAQELENLVVAYEPVWAIGTGHVATTEMAEEAHKHIRKVLGTLFGKTNADKISILYGGSVKPDNIRGIIEQENIDGALVGGASLEVDSFAQIVNLG